MLKLSKKYLLILLAGVVFLFSGKVSAKEIILQTNSKEVNVEDTVTLNVSVDNEDQSLYALKAKLSYDKDVFEVLEEKDFSEEIEDIVYNEQNNEFVILNKKGSNDNLFTINLKVKKDALNGKTTLTLSNLEVSNGTDSTKYDKKSVTLNVKGGKDVTATTTTKNNKTKNAKKTLNVKKTLLISAIALLILMALIAFINSDYFEKLNLIKKENKNKVSIVIALIIILADIILISLLGFNAVNKGDVDKDGKKDYKDIRKISEYLLNVTNGGKTSSSLKNTLNYYNADYNGDGKVTLDDVAALTQDVNNKTVYEVEVAKSSIENYYPSKNGNVEVNLSFIVNPSDNIYVESVFANGKYYKVTKDNDNYYASIKVTDKAGINDIVISKVKLSNGKEINIKPYTLKVDVLKEAPSIKNFDFTNEGKVSFELVDKDNSLEKATLVVLNNDEIVTTKKVKKDLNTFELSLEKGINYTIKILTDYDLDSSKDNDKNAFTDKLIYMKQVQLYDVGLKLNSVSNNYPLKGEKVTVYFTASSNVQEVLIDNKYYTVTKNNDLYSFTIDAPNEAGLSKYQVTGVILDSGEFRTKMDFSFDVLKDKPTVKNLMFDYNSHTITFDVVDKDKSLSTLKLQVINNETKEEAFTKDLDTEKSTFSYKADLTLGATYSIKITGNYDLDSKKGNDNFYQDYSLYNHVITIDKVSIKSVTDLDNLFPKQNENIEVALDIDIYPTKTKVTKVVIDGKETDVVYKDGHYYITFNEKTSGIKKHTISSIILENNTEVPTNFNIKLDVLKEKPAVKNFAYSTASKTISFTLEDKDKSIKNAKIVVTSKENGKKVLEEKLDLAKSLFELKIDLTESAKYDVNIIANYDLDSDSTNNKNEIEENLYTYQLTVYGVKLTSVQDTYYAKKNEEIELKFKAEITPEDNGSIISAVTIDGKVYDVIRNIEGTYSVFIKAKDTSGNKKYTITSATVGETEYATKLGFNVYVLKDKPTIEDLYIDESKSVPVITFNLKDNDSALDKGYAYIKDGSGNEVEKFTLKKGKNSIDLKDIATNLKDGATYYLDVKVNYDLDDTKNNKYETEEYLINNHIVKIYKVKLSLGENNPYYVNKDEEVNIKINATGKDLDTVRVKTFIIDNKEYEAIYNNGSYYVKVKTPTTSGIKTYNITKVVLTNDIEVSSSLEIKLDVLKDTPYINKFNLNEENGLITFELVDKDKAFQNGDVSISNETGNLITKEVKEKTTITYKFLEDMNYNIKITGNYNLDSDTTNEENLYTDVEMFSHDFLIGGNYQFTLNDLSITDSLTKSEKPVVSFTSSNMKNATIKEVVINGKKYNVSKVDGNYYEVILNDAQMTSGKHKVELESVTLDTMKTFKNNLDFSTNSLTYSVLKDAPSIKNINLTSNNTDKTITATFNLEDKDTTLTRLKALLVDSADKIIAEQELTPEMVYLFDTSSVTLSYLDNADGHVDGYYKVRFLADYDLGEEKYLYSDKNVGEKDILVQKDLIYIKDIYIADSRGNKIDNLYPSKKQKNYQVVVDVYVDNSINDYARSKYGNRAYQKVSVVTINGVDYSADKLNDYRSKITLDVPDTSGILNLTVNRVQLEYADYNVSFRQFYSVPEKSIKIDVLKDTPTIKNLSIKEDYAKASATFDFDVVLDEKAKEKDESFKNGSIALGELRQNINRGHNSITFNNIKKDENLDLVFEGSYDLDTDTLETTDQNEYENKEIYRVNYGLYDKETYEDIKITDGLSLSKNNNNYFEKNEDIKLNFNVTGIKEELGLDVEKVIIKDKEYPITKKDKYEVTYDSYNTFGQKEITITGVVLSNGKKVDLKKPYTFKPEILKDNISLDNYKVEVQNNKIKITSNLKDSDNSLIKANIKITTENGKELVNKPYEEEITIDKVKDVLRYYVEVYASYDRDIDITEGSSNYYETKLLEEIISFEENVIELKDITDINLYKAEKDNSINLLDTVNVNDLEKNLDNYFIEINMENAPSVHANIKKITTKDNELMLVLDFDNVSKENVKGKEFSIFFGNIENNKATNETHPDVAFKTLLKRLESNEDIVLKQNYDASLISEDTKYYVDNYSGKLDGNGFTIKNLEKPLFNKLTNANIKNLILENVVLDSNGRGALSNDASSTTVENVIVNRVTKKSASNGQNGGLIGNVNTRSTINSCAVKNIDFNIGNAQQNGGLVGYAENSTISNSYAIGKVNGGWNFNAGFVGNTANTTFTNNYSKVSVTGYTICDFACSYLGQSSYHNNISLGGTNRGFVNKYSSISNNYYLVTDGSISTNKDITNITAEQVNTNLFKQAKFDSSIWRLDNVTYENTPLLQTEKITSMDESINGYDSTKTILYNNLMKLMPYYSNEKIITMAKNIKDNYLNTKEIMHILPVDKNGNIVTYLTNDNVKRISKIKVVYKTKEKQEFNVTYDNTYDFVATYRIVDLKIDYNYKNYIIDSNSQVVNNLTNYLKKLNYTDNLDILTSTGDSRIYRDFYNETTVNELKEFVLSYLSNSNYNNITNNDIITTHIEKEVKEDKKIEKILYMYNYFRRFYDLDIDGIKLYQFMLFNMDGFDSSLTPKKIANLFLSDGTNFNTNETNTRYQKIFSNYTNLNTISKFLEYMVTEFSDLDMDKWTASQFKGYLAEVPVDGHPEVLYTLWDHFSNEDATYHNPYQIYNYVLPILTLPKDAAYIISSPVQFIIGAQRTYIVDPSNEEEQALLRRKVKSYTDRMSNYYNTAYGFLQDAKVFNDIHTYQLDKRYTKGANGETIFHNPYVTEEPFHKNLNEVMNQWAYNDYNAATANGTQIIWRVEGLMDGNLIPELGNVQEYTYQTWSHESAHNVDARLFLRNNGRRYDAGGEDYADGNLTQSFGQNDIVMNLSVNYDAGSRVGANLTYDRIASPSKIHDFYQKVFDTIYIMDYIEGKAFLELNDKEKSGVAVQVMYPNENLEGEDKTHLKYKYTVYQHIDEDKYKAMKLNSIEDLYKEKLVIFPNVYYSTYTDNRYGGEGINKARWYQPNNPYGRPDSYSIKWFAYEMLGYKGYNDGYIEYYSNINSNNGYKDDIMALKKITGYDSFEKYKNARFNEVESKLEYINNAIDINDYLQKFYEAMKKDAEYANTKIAEAWEKYPANLTDDSSTRARGNLLSAAKVAKYSSEVRYDLYYALKNATNDFEGNVYMNTKQQDTKNFKVKK